MAAHSHQEVRIDQLHEVFDVDTDNGAEARWRDLMQSLRVELARSVSDVDEPPATVTTAELTRAVSADDVAVELALEWMASTAGASLTEHKTDADTWEVRTP